MHLEILRGQVDAAIVRQVALGCVQDGRPGGQVEHRVDVAREHHRPEISIARDRRLDAQIAETENALCAERERRLQRATSLPEGWLHCGQRHWV